MKLMESDFTGPVNIGSEEMVSINELAKMVIKISGKDINIHNLYGNEFEKKYGHKCPLGVRGRNSNNTLFFDKLNWKVSLPLEYGLSKTYEWIYKLNNI
jgi:nucleoside-diphosphate-sugar epimerase